MSANDKGARVVLTTNAGMDQIDPDAWNRMVSDDDPSLRHEFLEGAGVE